MYSYYECLYLPIKIDSISEKLTIMFNTNNAKKILYSEADVFDYPHMFLKGTGTDNLSALFSKGDALLKYFKKLGAKYFVALANHHDNFNSTYHP